MTTPTHHNLKQFAEDGFAVVEGVLTETEIANALSVVDKIVADAPAPDDHVGYHFNWFHDDLDDGPLGQVLHTSKARDIIETLIAPHTLAPNEVIQVSTTPPPWDHRPGRGHLDGLTPPEDSGMPGTFSLLVGLLLTDQSKEDMGNLWVWPASHLANSAHFTSGINDADIALDPYPPIDPSHPPLQVTGKAGDMVIANYLLSHNMGGNLSNVTRKVIYFRIRTNAHRDHWQNCIRDPLFEFKAAKENMK